MSAPTRRGLLAGVAALAPVASAVPLAVLPAAPDALLLALCTAFHAIHDEAKATTTDEGLTGAQDRRRDVQHQIQPIVPVTAAGRAAKAKVAMHLLDEAFGPRLPGDFLDFGLTTLAEVAGVAPPAEAEDDGREPVEPAVFPDAELLAACAAADVVQRRQDALFTGLMRVEDDDERNRLLDRLEAEQVYELEAQTLAGHQARARTIVGWDKEALKPRDGGWNSHMVAALLADLTGGVVA